MVQCVGQALAVVLADSADTARAAARTVVVTYEDTGAKPVLSFVEGIERKSFLPPGNVKAISVRFVCVFWRFGVDGSMDGWMDGWVMRLCSCSPPRFLEYFTSAATRTRRWRRPSTARAGASRRVRGVAWREGRGPYYYRGSSLLPYAQLNPSINPNRPTRRRPTTGGQKHFYFEPQTTLAVPTENGVLNLYTSTQAPADAHTLVAKVSLGLDECVYMYV